MLNDKSDLLTNTSLEGTTVFKEPSFGSADFSALSPKLATFPITQGEKLFTTPDRLSNEITSTTSASSKTSYDRSPNSTRQHRKKSAYIGSMVKEGKEAFIEFAWWDDETKSEKRAPFEDGFAIPEEAMIGSGAQGKVYKVAIVDGDGTILRYCILKTIGKTKTLGAGNTLSEHATISAGDETTFDNNIAYFMGTYTHTEDDDDDADEKTVLALMPFFPLFYNDVIEPLATLRQFKSTFTITITAYMLRDLLVAMQAIHKKGYAHADVKPENMAVSMATSVPRAIMIDMEGALKNGASNFIGTILYTHPGCFADSKLCATASNDIYALGLSLKLMMGDIAAKKWVEYWENLNKTHNVSFELAKLQAAKYNADLEAVKQNKLIQLPQELLTRLKMLPNVEAQLAHIADSMACFSLATHLDDHRALSAGKPSLLDQPTISELITCTEILRKQNKDSNTKKELRGFYEEIIVRKGTKKSREKLTAKPPTAPRSSGPRLFSRTLSPSDCAPTDDEILVQTLCESIKYFLNAFKDAKSIICKPSNINRSIETVLNTLDQLIDLETDFTMPSDFENVTVAIENFNVIPNSDIQKYIDSIVEKINTPIRIENSVFILLKSHLEKIESCFSKNIAEKLILEFNAMHPLLTSFDFREMIKEVPTQDRIALLKMLLNLENPEYFLNGLITLKKNEILFDKNIAAIKEHAEPESLAIALAHLKMAKIYTEKYFNIIKTHPFPSSVAIELRMIKENGIIINSDILDLVLKVHLQKNKDKIVFETLAELNLNGLFNDDILTVITENHASMISLSTAFIALKKSGLLNEKNITSVLKHQEPDEMAWGIIYLHNKNLLTNENHSKIQEAAHPTMQATQIGKPKKTAGLFSPNILHYTPSSTDLTEFSCDL
ncbi:MAG: hypothetical protein NTZ67_02680 [Gammaproteobacteria bacterium]|nr:hypothetical protein [Gammaproteobacteria bacterium]